MHHHNDITHHAAQLYSWGYRVQVPVRAILLTGALAAPLLFLPSIELIARATGPLSVRPSVRRRRRACACHGRPISLHAPWIPFFPPRTTTSTAVCFLTMYASMNLACLLQSALQLHTWRPAFFYYSW